MRKLPLVLSCLLAISACARSTTGSSTPSTGGQAGGPSKQAQMICSAEAQAEITAALAMKPTAAVVPQWSRPDYSCRYAYGPSSFRLVVRDLPSKPATLAYYGQQVTAHGRRSSVNIGADEAVVAKDGSLVARKDLHVLLVDVSGLPPRFGAPPMPRDQVAYSIGGVIMSCWKGDGS